jgi:hypothetical protein
MGNPKYMYVHKESHPYHMPHAADDRHLELALYLRVMSGQSRRSVRSRRAARTVYQPV